MIFEIEENTDCYYTFLKNPKMFPKDGPSPVYEIPEDPIHYIVTKDENDNLKVTKGFEEFKT